MFFYGKIAKISVWNKLGSGTIVKAVWVDHSDQAGTPNLYTHVILGGKILNNHQ